VSEIYRAAVQHRIAAAPIAEEPRKAPQDWHYQWQQRWKRMRTPIAPPAPRPRCQSVCSNISGTLGMLRQRGSRAAIVKAIAMLGNQMSCCSADIREL
jgi:hypothetical protein